MKNRRMNRAEGAVRIRENVNLVFSGIHFGSDERELPVSDGVQLTFSGRAVAHGNRPLSENDLDLVARTVEGLPCMKHASSSAVDRYVSSRRFHIMCPDTDRWMAIAGATLELMSLGVLKILIASNSPEERDGIVKTFRVLDTAGSTRISAYTSDSSSDEEREENEKNIREFVTSPSPAVLIIGRDSFCRVNNIINREGENSLASLISLASPVVISSSDKISSGRRIASKAAVFGPSMSLVFSDEVRRIAGAVLYSPASGNDVSGRKDDTEQLEF